MKINRETFEIEFYDKDSNFINSIGIGSTRIRNSLFVEMIEELENEQMIIDLRNFVPDEYKRIVNDLVNNPIAFFQRWEFYKILNRNFLTKSINRALENLMIEKTIKNWEKNYKNKLRY